MVRDFPQLAAYLQFGLDFVGRLLANRVNQPRMQQAASNFSKLQCTGRQERGQEAIPSAETRLECPRFDSRVSVRIKSEPFERKEAEGAGLTSALIGVSARGAESGGM
jgi:hypothetical protein